MPVHHDLTVYRDNDTIVVVADPRGDYHHYIDGDTLDLDDPTNNDTILDVLRAIDARRPDLGLVFAKEAGYTDYY